MVWRCVNTTGTSVSGYMVTEQNRDITLVEWVLSDQIFQS
jgi:hypothetical protein